MTRRNSDSNLTMSIQASTICKSISNRSRLKMRNSQVKSSMFSKRLKDTSSNSNKRLNNNDD